MPDPPHATLFQACLGGLLQLGDIDDHNQVDGFPMAIYDSRHWVVVWKGISRIEGGTWLAPFRLDQTIFHCTAPVARHRRRLVLVQILLLVGTSCISTVLCFIVQHCRRVSTWRNYYISKAQFKLWTFPEMIGQLQSRLQCKLRRGMDPPNCALVTRPRCRYKIEE